MPPQTTQQVLLSPAELSYLHTSLTSQPPIRPDGRTPTQFRPLIAETDILPGTNGSARICFADGTEAIVGVKAEVEKTRQGYSDYNEDAGAGDSEEASDAGDKKGLNEWVELSVEIPGFRDDDSMPVFLAALLSEALLSDGEVVERLRINRRFHWKLYLDVCCENYLKEDQLELIVVDSIAINAFELPATALVTHYSSRTPRNTTTTPEVGRG